MRYTPEYRLFQFRAALRYLMIGVKHSKKFEYKRNRPLWLQYLMGVDRLLYRDRYAVEHFDALIAGADPVIGLLSAIKLAKAGRRSLIYPDIQNDMDQSYYDLCKKRFEVYMDGFPALVGMSTDVSSYSEFLTMLAEESSLYVDDKGRPLIMIASEATAIFTGIQDDEACDFWIESTVGDGNSRLAYWDCIRQKTNEFCVLSRDIGLMKRYGYTSPKCLIDCDLLIRTSYLGESFPMDFSCKIIDLSESSKSILNFDQFKFNDRIVDIAEINKVK